ncbi:PTS system EIIB component [Citrobacter rodentium ICC168]|uniref:PTS system EIIB component n=2 Tax=Citrobacter rodentium TaxID=67825 RepID=D2TH41_CITRI|nr:PTS system EIIB component [Citrobacter rodentium ICC168]
MIIMKIMAVCGSGLGSSFMVEMNIKKVLKKMDIEAEVEHADLSSATSGAADLFVMAKDIAASASVPEAQLVVINNIIDINELEAQLRAWFAKQ